MLAAIRTVHRGDAVIAPSSTRRLLEHLVTALPADEPGDPPTPARRPSPTSPTASARCSCSWPAAGRTPRSAGDLFVAEATVKTHVGRILAKLGARDRVQAVVVAYETGWSARGLSRRRRRRRGSAHGMTRADRAHGLTCRRGPRSVASERHHRPDGAPPWTPRVSARCDRRPAAPAGTHRPPSAPAA